MAELEDVTLDGKPLHSLRVADLKLALEHRNLPKSGQKNALIKRLQGALMLENLQRTSHSTPHMGLQPNSQIGEEMSQNSFIKQYLAKQQELLRHRLEREAREAADADDSPVVPEEDHTEGDDDDDDDEGPYLIDKHPPVPSQPPRTRAEGEGGGLPGMLGRRPDSGLGSIPHESYDTPAAPRLQRPLLYPGHEEPATPSPPRAVASLSVRVLGQPERQGVPPSMLRPQEKESAAPAEPGSAHPALLHQSRSARAAAGRIPQEDSDEEDDEEEDESEEDEEWGPAAAAARRGDRGGRSAPPQPPQQQPPPILPVPAGRERSRRKLQPPQHIPQLQVHQPPMQLRQPTPPPSPPPELSFPLPDTPKQSPPDTDEPEGPGPEVAARPALPAAMQRQDSDSSSRSSSPEPLQQRRPGPLSMLARKMESEGAFAARKMELEGALGVTKGMARDSEAGPGEASVRDIVVVGGTGPRVVVHPAGSGRGSESAGHIIPIPEGPVPLDMSGSQPRPTAVTTVTLSSAQEPRTKSAAEEHKERENCQPSWNRGPATQEEEAAADKGELDQARSTLLPQLTRKSPFIKEAPQPLTSPSGSDLTSPLGAPKRSRMFSDTLTGSMESPTKPPLHAQGVVLQGRHFIHTAADNVMEADRKAAERPEEKDVEMKQAEEDASNIETRKKGSVEVRDVELRSLRSPLTPAGRETRGKRGEKGGEREKQEEKKDRVKVSGSSDASDSDSSSSSRSSGSSQDKSSLSSQKKEAPGRKDDKGEKEKYDPKKEKKLPAREVNSQPNPSSMEVDPDSESSPAQAAPEAEPDNSESCLEESSTPKAFAARKISLTTSTKVAVVSGEGGPGDAESGGAAGRKRRWGSSTAVGTKKPSISITTDSLKSLIPDIKTNQEAVVDLHPEELHLSGEEDEVQRREQEEDSPSRVNREEQGLDKGLKIRRTVTQVVPGESQENGRKEEEEEKAGQDRDKGRTRKDRRKSSTSEDAAKTETAPSHDAEDKKVTPSDTLVRRSICQQKSGVSITIDDPVRTARQPSPSRNKVSTIVHVTNLVRPFTLGQLKELLQRTGTLVEEDFWIDKIKSHCYVTYSTTEEAVATRAALHGVKWPSSNPKVLSVDFSEKDELDFHRGRLTERRPTEHRDRSGPAHALPPLMPERGMPERGIPVRGAPGVSTVRDQWAEREREMERRERTRAEREWDRHKIRDFARPGEEGRRSHSRERRRRERARSKERKTERKEKGDEPPAKLLDDLFHKTKAAPCIYWLPLTEEQAAQRVLDRAERQKERAKLRKEEEEEENKKREEERKERIRMREEKGGASAAGSVPGGVGGWGGAGARGGDTDRERERGRDREAEKRKDGYRPRGPSGGAVAGRRSRSRSNQRDRRR